MKPKTKERRCNLDSRPCKKVINLEKNIKNSLTLLPIDNSISIVMDNELFDQIQLTVKEVEHRLGISTMTLFYWRHPEKYFEDKGIREIIPPIPFIISKKCATKHFIVFPYQQAQEWLAIYRPAIAHKLADDSCACKHCSGKRAKRLRSTVAASRQLQERPVRLAG